MERKRILILIALTIVALFLAIVVTIVLAYINLSKISLGSIGRKIEIKLIIIQHYLKVTY